MASIIPIRQLDSTPLLNTQTNKTQTNKTTKCQKLIIIFTLTGLVLLIYSISQLASDNKLNDMPEVSMYNFTQTESYCQVNEPYHPSRIVRCTLLNITLVAANSSLYYTVEECVKFVNYVKIDPCSKVIPEIQTYIKKQTKFRLNSDSTITKYKPETTINIILAWVGGIIIVFGFLSFVASKLNNIS